MVVWKQDKKKKKSLFDFGLLSFLGKPNSWELVRVKKTLEKIIWTVLPKQYKKEIYTRSDSIVLNKEVDKEKVSNIFASTSLSSHIKVWGIDTINV